MKRAGSANENIMGLLPGRLKGWQKGSKHHLRKHVILRELVLRESGFLADLITRENSQLWVCAALREMCRDPNVDTETRAKGFT